MSGETILREGVEPSNMIKPAFTTKYLDSEKEETDSEIITLRLNKDDREVLDELKFLCSFAQDSVLLKQGIRTLRNVLLKDLGAEFTLRLSDERRRRPVSKYRLIDGKISKL